MSNKNAIRVIAGTRFCWIREWKEGQWCIYVYGYVAEGTWSLSHRKTSEDAFWWCGWRWRRRWLSKQALWRKWETSIKTVIERVRMKEVTSYSCMHGVGTSCLPSLTTTRADVDWRKKRGPRGRGGLVRSDSYYFHIGMHVLVSQHHTHISG